MDLGQKQVTRGRATGVPTRTAAASSLEALTQSQADLLADVRSTWIGGAGETHALCLGKTRQDTGRPWETVTCATRDVTVPPPGGCESG